MVCISTQIVPLARGLEIVLLWSWQPDVDNLVAFVLPLALFPVGRQNGRIV